jgi:S-adenosylmethionine hydrolase
MSNLVLLSDFGGKEHFVAAMKGVAVSVDKDISIYDITHEIEPFNIWEASWMLVNAVPYWPHFTVFVAVVDPGVGTLRKSLAVQMNNGNLIICPDNGILTFFMDKCKNAEIRIIDENVHRRPASEDFYTFSGRDLYVYTGARLAAGIIAFNETGPLLSGDIVLLDYQKARIVDNKRIEGTIVKVEQPFGNLVTDITTGMLHELSGQMELSDACIQIRHDNQLIYNDKILFKKSFGYAEQADPLIYIDSSGLIGIAINGDSFAKKFNVHYGYSWHITITID